MNAIYNIPNDDPRVQAAIKSIVAMQESYTIDVVCSDIDSEMLTQPGWTIHTVTFSHGPLLHTAIAGQLALFPQLSITEMKAIGLLPK